MAAVWASLANHRRLCQVQAHRFEQIAGSIMALCKFTRVENDEIVYLTPSLVVAVHRGDHGGTSVVMQVADRGGGPLVITVSDGMDDVVKRIDQARRS